MHSLGIQKSIVSLNLFFAVLMSLGCSDEANISKDDSGDTDLVEQSENFSADELYLEVSFGSNTVRYEGGYLDGYSFSYEDDLTYQNFPIAYYLFDEERDIDSKAMIWLSNIRSYPTMDATNDDGSFAGAPPFELEEIIQALESSDWPFLNYPTLEKSVAVGIFRNLGTTNNNNYYSRGTNGDQFNITQIFTSHLYYPKTDKLSDEAFVIVIGNFNARITSPIDTLDISGVFRTALQ